jgi:hypothetical protein
MKTKLLAIVAVIGFAIAAPSFAHTGTHKNTGVKTAPVKKQLVVKPGAKLKLTAKLACAKPIMVKGVKRCPSPVKGAPTTK